jgi:hypothetical protein
MKVFLGRGSGKVSTDTPYIVDDDEHSQDQLVIKVQLGKGQSLAHKTSKVLAEGQVPSLDMGCFATFLADGVVFSSRKDLLIGVPEIAKGVAASVGFREPVP